MMRSTARRVVTIPDGLGKTDFSRRDVSLPRAPWDSPHSRLADRPETAPRQPVIMTEAPRRREPMHETPARMAQLIAAELRRPRDDHDPTEVFI
ncbi:hypothetical protein [Thioclava sp. GXIMD4215]|uniref:hypothetical protein n=1 Tax=Thioclava sp. GXIMD4215 TaxID=3131928 RepID=UPI0032495FA3